MDHIQESSPSAMVVEVPHCDCHNRCHKLLVTDCLRHCHTVTDTDCDSDRLPAIFKSNYCIILIMSWIICITLCLACMVIDVLSAGYHNTGASVQLFQWKWTDIAEECENFLSLKGYKGKEVD